MTRKYTIMLVDDHEFTRKHMASLINLQTDMKVVAQAGSGEECLQQIGEVQPDLLVMDILLPMLNGIETTRTIIAANPAQAVIILSNYDGRTLMQSVKSAGARGYVKKDTAYEDLIPAIQHVLAGGTWFAIADT